jgi:hypothetical protein
MEADRMLKHISIWLVMAIAAVIAAQAQQGRWAASDDATAKFMLDAERHWQDASCDHNKITEEILAVDFLGTLPDGTQYGKEEEVRETEDPSKSAQACRVSDTKVRIFGDNLAIVYGKAYLVRKLNDRRDEPGCLFFTDTWLKRGGKWQIVAAHDGQVPCSE